MIFKAFASKKSVSSSAPSPSFAKLTFFSGLGACLLAISGQQFFLANDAPRASLLFGAAIILFIIPFWRKEFDPLSWKFQGGQGSAESGPRRARWPTAVAILAFFAALLFAILSLSGFYQLEPRSPQAWTFHLAAILAALLGAKLLTLSFPPQGTHPTSFLGHHIHGHSDSPTNHHSSAGPEPAPSPVYILLSLATIIAVALVFRLWQFDRLPFGVWYDEAEHGLQALRILRDADFRPIFEPAITGPAHYLYLVAASFEVFGVSVQSVRLVSVLFGVLTVFAGYLVAAELFGRRVGLVVAAFLAVSSWAVTLSRFGMYATMSTPLFTLLTAAFLLRGLRRNHLSDFALSGLWMGLGLCFYTSFRLFIPAIILFLIYGALYHRISRGQWPSSLWWIGLVLMISTAAIVVSPIVIYAIKHPDLFWGRVSQTYVFSGVADVERWPILLENIKRHLLMFNVRGDPNGRHHLPGAPMLDPITAALFIIGLFYAIRRALQPAYLLLLAWLGLGLLGGILSLAFEAPQSLRSNATLPVVYLIAAIPLATLGRAWTLGVANTPTLTRSLATFTPILLIGALNFQTYFIRQANDFSVWNAFSTPETLAARILAETDVDTDIYLTAFIGHHPTIRFLAPEAPRHLPIDTTAQLPFDFSENRDAVLILNDQGIGLIDEIKRLFPAARVTEWGPSFSAPRVLFSVQLSSDDIRSIRGVRVRYFTGNETNRVAVIDRHEPRLFADWNQHTPLPLPFLAKWEAVLQVTSAGTYEFTIDAPDVAELRIGKQQILSGVKSGTARVTLAAGSHLLELTAAGGPGIVALYWRPPNGAFESLPSKQLYNRPELAHGLLGRYYPNGDWREPEAFSRIDKRFDRYIHILPMPRPYTVEWTGQIAVPLDGIYRFGLESIDESQLWVGGSSVVRADHPNRFEEGSIALPQGLHDIRIRFADRTGYTHVNVFWHPPGGVREILPASLLQPPSPVIELVEKGEVP